MIALAKVMSLTELTRKQVIPMAFDMMINGPGGAPQVDFSVTSKDCDVFEGTQLKNCPNIG